MNAESDAGVLSDGATNRGIVFIPEVGDQVMVSFEQGNPHRPYVSGSMFHGKNASAVSNNVRSIITKSGCKIVLMMKQKVFWLKTQVEILFLWTDKGILM